MIFLSVTSFSQNQLVGGKGGVSLTNASSDVFTDNDFRLGYLGGITYQYKLEKFHIEVDFLYAQKGFRNSAIYTDTSDKHTGIEGVSDFNYDYFSLPIKAGITMGDKVSGFFNVGLAPSFIYNAQTIVPTCETINGKVIDVADQVTKLDISALVEVGGEYTIKNQFVVFSSLAFQKSFTSLTNDNYYPNGKITHYGISLSLGVKYILGGGVTQQQ